MKWKGAIKALHQSHPPGGDVPIFHGLSSGDIVRRLVGDLRLDSPEQLQWMLEVYGLLRLFVNGVQPTAKRIGTVHRGDRMRRLHDTPRTPLRRLLATATADEPAVADFQNALDVVSPLTLKRQIGALLDGRPPARQSPPGRRWPEAADA